MLDDDVTPATTPPSPAADVGRSLEAKASGTALLRGLPARASTLPALAAKLAGRTLTPDLAPRLFDANSIWLSLAPPETDPRLCADRSYPRSRVNPSGKASFSSRPREPCPRPAFP